MAKLRKMLGKVDSPYIISLMKLIETESENTIVKWCNEWIQGNMKLTEAKKIIKEVQVAAREVEGNPAEQAVARTIGATTATINTVTSSLGLAFYGSAAISYSAIVVDANDEVYDEIAIINEPNPAKINWNC